MSVSLLTVWRAARARALPFPGESAGYLVFLACEELAVAPRSVSLANVGLDAEGRVWVRGREAADDERAERDLRVLLRQLIEVASTPGIALVRAAQRAPGASLAAFSSELSKALIPFNRAAARRALSRLHRETERAVEAGELADEEPALPGSRAEPPKLEPAATKAPGPVRPLSDAFGGATPDELISDAPTPEPALTLPLVIERSWSSWVRTAERPAPLPESTADESGIVVPTRILPLGDPSPAPPALGFDFTPVTDARVKTEVAFGGGALNPFTTAELDSRSAARRTSSASSSTAGREERRTMREIGQGGLGGAKSRLSDGVEHPTRPEPLAARKPAMERPHWTQPLPPVEPLAPIAETDEPPIGELGQNRGGLEMLELDLEPELEPEPEPQFEPSPPYPRAPLAEEETLTTTHGLLLASDETLPLGSLPALPSSEPFVFDWVDDVKECSPPAPDPGLERAAEELLEWPVELADSGPAIPLEPERDAMPHARDITPYAGMVGEKSDVRKLLSGFQIAESLPEPDLRGELKRLAGLDDTPKPP